MKKIRLKLECIEPGFVQGHGGAECHGLLFAMMETANFQWSKEIHAAATKPFALGPLRGRARRTQGKMVLAQGTEYFFSLSALNEQMTEFIDLLCKQIRPQHQFRLGTATCRWQGWEPLLTNIGYSDLLHVSPPARKIRIRYTSPTTFRSQGTQSLFPTPPLVFQSLAERWNTFSETKVNIHPLSDIVVSKYNLRTVYVAFSTYGQIGFIGDVEYALSGDAMSKKVIVALARYAEFAGIGYKTGMGMGEASVIISNGGLSQ